MCVEVRGGGQVPTGKARNTSTMRKRALEQTADRQCQAPHTSRLPRVHNERPYAPLHNIDSWEVVVLWKSKSISKGLDVYYGMVMVGVALRMGKGEGRGCATKQLRERAA